MFSEILHRCLDLITVCLSLSLACVDNCFVVVLRNQNEDDTAIILHFVDMKYVKWIEF